MKTITFIFIFTITQLTLLSQWQQTAGTPQGAGVTDMVVLGNGTLIVTTASYNWPNGQAGGIRRSTNAGATWQNVINVFNGRTLHLGSTGKIFASYWPFPSNEGMYYSTNGGLNWTQSYAGFANDNVFSIASKNNDSIVFIGTRYGVARSINNGAWIFVSSGLPANSRVRDLKISSTGIIFAATTNGVYKSADNGGNWINIPGLASGDTAVTLNIKITNNDIAVEELEAGTSNGKVYETDGSYTALVISAIFDVSLEVAFLGGPIQTSGYAILAFFTRTGSQQGGVARTTNGGQNYNFMNEGLPNPAPVSAANITSDQFSSAIMYAGLFQNQSDGAKIYKRIDPIGIQQISTEIPIGYFLSQNYPNPFNPTTKIRFAIPSNVKGETSNAKIIIFDIIGREVATLVNEQLKPGTYEVDFDGSKYSSGVYFYKLISADYTETKRMVLIK